MWFRANVGRTPRTRPCSRRGGCFTGAVVRQSHPDMGRGEGNPNGGPALRRSWVTSGRFAVCTGKPPSHRLIPSRPPLCLSGSTFARVPRRPSRAASSTTAGVSASEVSSLGVVGFSPGRGVQLGFRVWGQAVVMIPVRIRFPPFAGPRLRGFREGRHVGDRWSVCASEVGSLNGSGFSLNEGRV